MSSEDYISNICDDNLKVELEDVFDQIEELRTDIFEIKKNHE